MTTFRNIRSLFSVVAALTLSATVSTPVHAWDQSRVHQPGSFEAIMNAKMPGVFGPRLDVPPEKSEARTTPGSFAAFQARRLGIHVGGESAIVPPTTLCSTAYPAGSFEALMRAKNLRVYDHHSDCK